MEIIFFDINDELIATYKEILKNVKHIKLSFIVSSINDLLNNGKYDAIISPANSFGDMTGGIDRVYKKLDPEIEQKTMNKINDAQIPDNYDRPHLPVGNNLLINFNHPSCKYMICMPTMYIPRNIVDTNNVSLAFYGLLKTYDQYKIKIACPGLGTGIGGLSHINSAKQILQAINYFYSKQK